MCCGSGWALKGGKHCLHKRSSLIWKVPGPAPASIRQRIPWGWMLSKVPGPESTGDSTEQSPREFPSLDPLENPQHGSPEKFVGYRSMRLQQLSILLRSSPDRPSAWLIGSDWVWVNLDRPEPPLVLCSNAGDSGVPRHFRQRDR